MSDDDILIAQSGDDGDGSRLDRKRSIFNTEQEYIISSLEKLPEQRFLTSFNPSYKSLGRTSFEYNQDGSCFIYRKQITISSAEEPIASGPIIRDTGVRLPEFNILEEQPLIFEGLETVSITYSENEKNSLERLYGPNPPILQVDLEEIPIRGDIGIQNSVIGEQISYNSLSSLGAISQEGFTISATTGSVTGLITEQTETITDVGGLSGAGRDRTIIGGGVGGADVTTRGY